VLLASFGGPLTPDVIDALCHAVRGMRGLVVPATFQVGGSQIDAARGDLSRISVRVVSRPTAVTESCACSQGSTLCRPTFAKWWISPLG